LREGPGDGATEDQGAERNLHESSSEEARGSRVERERGVIVSGNKREETTQNAASGTWDPQEPVKETTMGKHHTDLRTP